MLVELAPTAPATPATPTTPTLAGVVAVSQPAALVVHMEKEEAAPMEVVHVVTPMVTLSGSGIVVTAENPRIFSKHQATAAVVH